jgi:hypothetical protein
MMTELMTLSQMFDSTRPQLHHQVDQLQTSLIQSGGESGEKLPSAGDPL